MLSTLLCLVISGGAGFHLQAAMVGKYDHVQNLPGYIGDSSSDAYYSTTPYLTKQSSDYDIELRSASQIMHEDYFNKDGSINVRAIDKKIILVERHRSVAYISYCAERKSREANADIRSCEHEVNESILAKWRKKKLYRIYKFTLNELRAARALADNVTRKTINNASSQQFLHHLFQGLETFASIKDQDPITNDYSRIFKHVTLRKWQINTGGSEASNLMIPAERKAKDIVGDSRVFFSPKEAKNLHRSGKLDISTLNPVDSGFWRKPHSIREFDTRNYNASTGIGEEITDPDHEISVVYEFRSISSGHTPKFIADYKGKSWKVKYLVGVTDIGKSMNFLDVFSRFRKYGQEVNTETAVNNLAAALGYTVNPTFYKKSIRVYLPQEDPSDVDEFNALLKKLLAEMTYWGSNITPKNLLPTSERMKRVVITFI